MGFINTVFKAILGECGQEVEVVIVKHVIGN